MTKSLFAFPALLLAVATPAFANEKPTEISFQRDGVTYVYTKTLKGDHVVLSGYYSGGERFELTVRGDQVTGVVGGGFVSFKMPHDKHGLTTEMAAR